jgi:hypothetical protein
LIFYWVSILGQLNLPILFTGFEVSEGNSTLNDGITLYKSILEEEFEDGVTLYTFLLEEEPEDEKEKYDRMV